LTISDRQGRSMHADIICLRIFFTQIWAIQEREMWKTGFIHAHAHLRLVLAHRVVRERLRAAERPCQESVRVQPRCTG